ncbi:BTB/POZ domain [Popillia japonica]|uniref:BTB/POZ domain n=1 Tax=Popillia japonica TaxID=7064 RepID=A0AAW1KG72_POPJA
MRDDDILRRPHATLLQRPQPRSTQRRHPTSSGVQLQPVAGTVMKSSLTAATTTLNSTTSSNVFRRPAAARRRNCYEVVTAKMMRKTKYDIKNFEEKCREDDAKDQI